MDTTTLLIEEAQWLNHEKQVPEPGEQHQRCCEMAEPVRRLRPLRRPHCHSEHRNEASDEYTTNIYSNCHSKSSSSTRQRPHNDYPCQGENHYDDDHHSEKAMKFEIRKSNNPDQPYYWRIVADKNGETLAHSETYVSKADCHNAIAIVAAGAATAEVDDLT